MDILVSLEVGPTPNLCLRRTDTGVPIEKVVSRQKLRPGTGYLSVRVTTDGPTRVLRINYVQQNNEKIFARTEVPDWRLRDLGWCPMRDEHQRRRDQKPQCPPDYRYDGPVSRTVASVQLYICDTQCRTS